MRVLIIAQYFPPDMGGGATRAYNAAKGLMLNGCDVVIVSAFPHYPTGSIPRDYRWRILRVERFEGFRIIRTFVPPLASKGLARRMILFLSFMASSLLSLPFIGGVDIVWAANPNILSIIPAQAFSLFKHCPVALNVDDPWPEDLYLFGLLREGSIISKASELLARFAYNRASLITPISPCYIKVIREKYGIPESKIHVVRGGVDLNMFKHIPNRSDGKFKVLYSGAFSVAYDFNQVLKAAKLLEEYEDVEIILQGSGELLNHIKNRVTEMNLKNVRIMDKILSREEVAKLLSEADALLLPLRDFGRPYLGISSKLYEYQAAGRPIICVAEGQPAEFVKETGSGVVVKPGDYKGLARAIIYLRDNIDLAKRMGLSGRYHVEASLSIERIGFQMMSIFESLLRPQ